MPDNLRFGVIGCGRFGSRRAASVVESSDARLVAISEINKELGEKLSKQYGCENYPNYWQMLKRSDLDCVIVSLPNYLHYQAVMAALNYKKHVFAEKPLALNSEEARKMCEAARTFGVTLKVGANLRYFPNVQKAKELLDSKIIGDLTFLRGWVGNAGPGIEWFYDPQMSGGGTLIDNGPHILDLARWFLGEITECKGYVGSIITVSVEDIAMATFKTEGGKLAYVQSSWIDWASYMYMEIYGKEGFIRIDQRLPSCCTSLGEKDKMLKKFDYSDLKPQSYTLELADYIDAIRNGRQPQPSGYDGMRILQMIHAVYESSRLGTAVNL